MREIENKVERMPIEYVLKADYVREMQRMNDTFSETLSLISLLRELLTTDDRSLRNLRSTRRNILCSFIR